MCFTFTEVCIFAITVAVCVYVFLLYQIRCYRRRGFATLPSYPLLGSLGPVIFRRISFSEHIGRLYSLLGKNRFGVLFEFVRPVLMLKDPELIKLITVKDFDYFMDRDKPLTEECDDMFGKSVFALEGQRWRHMRAMISPVFTASKMRLMFDLVNQCACRLAGFLSRRCYEHQAKTGKMLSVEMKDLWSRYANDVIATTGFGLQVDSLRDPENEIFVAGKTLTDFSGVQALIFLGYLLSTKLMKLLHVPLLPFKVKRFVRDLVEQAISVREREDVGRPDLIQQLMRQRTSTGSGAHSSPGGGGGGSASDSSGGSKPKSGGRPELNNEDIAAQVMVFLLAGFETTSTLLSFMSNRLAVLPHLQERVRKEVDDTLERHGGRITYEAVHEMKYLDMVISETLRMYPPVEVLDRKCIRHYVIPATATNPRVELRPGDPVWVPIYGLHRDPTHWPDPERFDPERFSDENKANITPFTYLPFGSGPRICIGLRFAMMEVKVAMIQLLSRFELRTVERTPVELRLSTDTFNITVDGGFWLGIEPRSPARTPAPA